MSKILFDYAVAFSQVEGTTAANLAFLHQMGVVTKPSAVVPDVTLAPPGMGTITVPAVLTLSGLFQVGDEIDATFTSDVPFTGQAPLTFTEQTTAADAAILWADLIKGIDQLTAVAVGDTVEVYAFAPGVDVLVENPVYTAAGDPFVPSIVTVTDPEDLPYYTDQYADIAGAFDGGLTRVYLAIVEDAADIPALIAQQECDFFTIYGSVDFTGDEYLTAFATWQGVKGWSTLSDVDGAAWAAEQNTSIFYEDTLLPEEVSAYFGIFSFANLLSAPTWRNQQYIPVNSSLGAPVTDLGTANLLFDLRLSFYIKDDEQGTRLAFFVAGGKSITTPYINAEIELIMQADMTNFISTNQPMNIETNRRLLEQVGNKIIEDYVDAALLDPNGTNEITITTSNEQFIVSGDMVTAEAVALWRVKIDAIQQSGV